MTKKYAKIFEKKKKNSRKKSQKYIIFKVTHVILSDFK